jgi:hypothetical protein
MYWCDDTYGYVILVSRQVHVVGQQRAAAVMAGVMVSAVLVYKQYNRQMRLNMRLSTWILT